MCALLSGGMMAGCVSNGPSSSSSSPSNTESSQTSSSSSSGSSQTSAGSSSSNINKDGTIDITGAPKIYEALTLTDQEIIGLIKTIDPLKDNVPSLNVSALDLIRSLIGASCLSKTEIAQLVALVNAAFAIANVTEEKNYDAAFHKAYAALKDFITSVDGDKLGYIAMIQLSLFGLTTDGGNISSSIIIGTSQLLSGMNIPTNAEELASMTEGTSSFSFAASFLAPFKEIITSGADYSLDIERGSYKVQDTVIFGRAMKEIVKNILNTFTEKELGNLLLMAAFSSNPIYEQRVASFKASLLTNPIPYINKMGAFISSLDFTIASWEAIVEGIKNVLVATNQNNAAYSFSSYDAYDKTYLDDAKKLIVDTSNLISGEEVRSLIHLLGTLLEDMTITEWGLIMSVVAANIPASSLARGAASNASPNAMSLLLAYYDKCYAKLSPEEKVALSGLFEAAGLTYSDVYAAIASIVSLDLSTEEGKEEASLALGRVLVGAIAKFQVEKPYNYFRLDHILNVKKGGSISKEFLAQASKFVNVNDEGEYSTLALSSSMISNIVFDSSSLGATDLSYDVALPGGLGTRTIVSLVKVIPTTLNETFAVTQTLLDSSTFPIGEYPYTYSADGIVFEKGFPYEGKDEAILSVSGDFWTYEEDNLALVSSFGQGGVLLSALDFSSAGTHYAEVTITDYNSSPNREIKTFFPYYVADQDSVKIASIEMDNASFLQGTSITEATGLYGNCVTEYCVNGVAYTVNAFYSGLPLFTEVAKSYDLTTLGAQEINSTIKGATLKAKYLVLPLSDFQILNIQSKDYVDHYKVGDSVFILDSITSEVSSNKYYQTVDGIRYSSALTVYVDADPMEHISFENSFNTDTEGQFELLITKSLPNNVL